MKLYIIRHGETPYNAKNIHQTFDTPLSEEGVKQAHALAEKFTHPLDIIISSPMNRAKTTAQIFSKKRNIQILESELFVELKKPSELAHKEHVSKEALSIKDAMHKNFHNPHFYYSDEENFVDFKKRITQGIQFVVDQKKGNIAVVTHGAVFSMILGLLLYGDELTSHDYQLIRPFFDVSNTGISTFYTSSQTKTGWKLESWNVH